MPHQPNISRSEIDPDGAVTGPAAHEDLTIAEILETMRVPAQDRPGEQCFQDGNGLRHWVSDVKAVTFIGESGALHPSDYAASTGIAWELRFFIQQTLQSTTTTPKPHTMNTKSAAGDAGQVKDAVKDTVNDTVNTAKNTIDTIKGTVDKTLKPLEESATAAYESLCKETSQFVERASEKIRGNPVPAVVGAAMFGAAVCYLLVSGRREPTLRDRFEPLADAGDNAISSLRSLYDNLKFW